MPEVLKASSPADWRPLDPRQHPVRDLPTGGRVVIELAPAFAPLHVRNIKTLTRAGYFNGCPSSANRDNYVAQWGDPRIGIRCLPASARSPPNSIQPFPRKWLSRNCRTGMFTPPKSASPMACRWRVRLRCTRSGWRIATAMVGVGRDLDAESGSGAELYVVIGHAPRHLDRNVALVGRVVKGVELLSGLPRGSAEMGFYTKTEKPLLIKSIRVAADVPAAERSNLEVLRTDTPTFTALIESRRNRPEDFFKVPAGKIDLCNVPLPVREKGAK